MPDPLKIKCPSCEKFCGFAQPDGSEPRFTGCHALRDAKDCPMAVRLPPSPLDEEARIAVEVAKRPVVGCTSRRRQLAR